MTAIPGVAKKFFETYGRHELKAPPAKSGRASVGTASSRVRTLARDGGPRGRDLHPGTPRAAPHHG